MGQPSRVLNVVELVDPDRDAPPPRVPLVVSQVRQYVDGAYKYSVVAYKYSVVAYKYSVVAYKYSVVAYKYSVVASEDEQWVTTIYLADQVRRTGERADLAACARPASGC